MYAGFRQEFLERLQELERLGYTPGRKNGKRAPLNMRVKGLLVWYFGQAWPNKSPLQVPSQSIRHFRYHYLAIA